MSIASRIRKLAQYVAAEVYWKLDAHEQDNYAAKYIIVAPVPRGTEDELVVAEIDKQAEQRGGAATRIIREFKQGRR